MSKKLTPEQARQNALESKRKYYYKNRDKALKYAKSYYKDNKDKLLEQSKGWRDSHPEKVKEYNKKAFDLFMKSAKQGLAAVQYYLGDIYYLLFL